MAEDRYRCMACWWQPPSVLLQLAFAYIIVFEYTIVYMGDDLRRFKSEIFQATAHPHESPL